MATTYLLHFTTPLRHARHYCGHAPNGLEERMAKHRAGNGSKLVRALMKAGGNFTLACSWEYGTVHQARVNERKLKDSHHLKRYCPICRAERG